MNPPYGKTYGILRFLWQLKKNTILFVAPRFQVCNLRFYGQYGGGKPS
jgi:hypothetical protein